MIFLLIFTLKCMNISESDTNCWNVNEPIPLRAARTSFLNLCWKVLNNREIPHFQPA